MSGDFDKSEGEFNPILNALKGAQNKRQSTEENLKNELQEVLDQKVSAYIDTLGLGEKIAAEAIKGGTTITVDLDAHHENLEKICISNSDESTGFKFAKLWDEFYELMRDSLSVRDTITCELKKTPYKTFKESNHPRIPGTSYIEAHTFKPHNHRWLNEKECGHEITGSVLKAFGSRSDQRYQASETQYCTYPKNHPVHSDGYAFSVSLKISWTN